MPGSPNKAISRRPFDVETGARDVGCADSCNSLDDFPKAPGSAAGSNLGSPHSTNWDTPRSILSCKHGGLAAMKGSLSSGKLDTLDEDADGHEREPTSSGWQLKCTRGASVAAVCLLLTLGSFVVPKSGHGLSSVMVSVGDLSSKARQGFARQAAVPVPQTDAAIPTRKSQRNCLRQQLPETNSTQQVSVHRPVPLLGELVLLKQVRWLKGQGIVPDEPWFGGTQLAPHRLRLTCRHRSRALTRSTRWRNHGSGGSGWCRRDLTACCQS